MIKLIHPIAGTLAMLTIAIFWIATVLSELSGSHAAIVAVKTALPWGLLVLVPAVAAAGGSGITWSKGNRSGVAGRKLARMPFIAANGILVLIPSALFLASKANAGEFDGWFYGVQAVELLAGATNLTLLGLSMRDGLRLTKWRRKSLLKPSTDYKTRLVGRDATAENIVTVRLERPEGFAFTAGQAVYLTLPIALGSDKKGKQRSFTLSSAPSDQELTITTRISDSAFKQALLQLPAGSELALDGPYGDMTLEERRPAVMIAGGIGITPFRSMIREAAKRRTGQKILLLHSVRTEAEAVFLDELSVLAASNEDIVFVPTLTGSDNTPTGWEHGRVSADLIARHSGAYAAPIYYVVGPPAMAKEVWRTLISIGVSNLDIRTEEFNGYS